MYICVHTLQNAEARQQGFHYILAIAQVCCALLHYCMTPLLIAFDWLQVDDKEVFRVCMEYFEFLGKSLYEERCVCLCMSSFTLPY